MASGTARRSRSPEIGTRSYGGLLSPPLGESEGVGDGDGDGEGDGEKGGVCGGSGEPWIGGFPALPPNPGAVFLGSARPLFAPCS